MAISRDKLGSKHRPVFDTVRARTSLLVHPSVNSVSQDTTLIKEPRCFAGSLAKKYELICEIGSGGMGVIYKAKQPLLDRYYAIKMLHLHKKDSMALARFHQEAKAVSNLNHPNVIGVHDFGFTEDDEPYMVMDFIDGVTLAHLISSSGSVPQEKALNIFVQIANGMIHAHARGVLHRDLKPGNIMLRDPENSTTEVKIVDFGIAKISGQDTSVGLTRTGDVFGSPLYMSPEQSWSAKVDARSDIYSLGCLMYEALTGHPPFLADTIIQTMFMHMNDNPPNLNDQSTTKFPAGLDFVVRKCLAKNAADRYQTMLDLQKDLVRVAAGQNIKEERLLPKSINARSIFRSKKFAVASLICLVMTIITSMYALIEMRFKSKEDEAQKSAVRFSTKLQEMNNNSLETLSSEDFARQERQDGRTAIDLKGLFANDAAMSELDGDDKLLSLGLKDCNLTAAGFKHMNLPNLQSLDLAESDVCDEMLESIGNLKHLKHLSLSSTKLSNKDVSQLLKLKQLQVLDLRKTQITDEACRMLAKMPSLTTLNISCNNVSDKGLAELVSLPNLECLDLMFDNITDSGVAKLASMSSLRILILSGTHISDRGVRLLSKMQLKRLFLADTQITEKSAPYLVKMDSLVFLDLRSTVRLGQEIKEFICDGLERVIVRI